MQKAFFEVTAPSTTDSPILDDKNSWETGKVTDVVE